MKIISITPSFLQLYGPYEFLVCYEEFPSLSEIFRRLFFHKYNRKYVTRTAISDHGIFWWWEDTGKEVGESISDSLDKYVDCFKVKERLNRAKKACSA